STLTLVDRVTVSANGQHYQRNRAPHQERHRDRGVTDVRLDAEGRDTGPDRKSPRLPARHSPGEENQQSERQHRDVGIPRVPEESGTKGPQQHGAADETQQHAGYPGDSKG